MQNSGNPVSEWSDGEIQAALVRLGSAAVPVTPTTRPMLERRIEKLLFKKQHEPAQNDTDVLEPQSKTERTSIEGAVSGQSDRANDEGYYVVVVNAEGTAVQPLSPFYTTKSDALRAMKSIPGARFKKFNTPASAEAFSNSPGSSSSYSTPNSAGQQQSLAKEQNVTNSDKPNQFPSLKTQDLSRFRRVVEGGDVSEFLRTVWGNPRYLINCYSDTPEILQSGFHYNALHCAVRAGQLEICKELLSLLQSDDFWRLVYPNDTPQSILQRRSHVLDLYFNMQDTRLGETPLHFASKLGHLEIVRLLLSQPSLDTTITNVFHQTAADIVCQSARSSLSTLQDKVTDLMNAPPIYYVPVLRAADNCTPPQLTPPCTIAEYHHHLHHGTLSDDRGTPVIGQAFAGPMSPAQAEEFYREWRSPSNSGDWRKALQIKRADPSRGFERVGRQLAEQCDVGWQEYWGFLGCYCDLRRAEGLDKLEQYLDSHSTPHQHSTRLNEDSTSLLNTSTGANKTANISRELFPTDVEEKEEAIMETVAEDGETEERDVMGKGGGVGRDGGNCMCGELAVIRDSGRDLESVLEGVASLTISEGKEGGRGGEDKGEGGGGNGGEGEGRYVSGDVEQEEESCVQKHEVEYYSSPPVSQTLPCSAQESKPCADSGRWSIFLLGDEPTKLDRDVYLAVRGAPCLTTARYPRVVEWMNRVKGFSENAQKGWKTPRSNSSHPSSRDSGGGREDTQTLGSPLLVTSPPHSPLPRPPILPSPHSPPHRLHTGTLSPRHHFSPLHRSLTASSSSSTPSRLHHTTPIPRKVLSNATQQT